MSACKPEDRIRKGAETQAEIFGRPIAKPRTVVEASWRDFVFAEVWHRPGLDRRSKFWIAISSAASRQAAPEMLDGYMRGALALGELTVPELREGALHLAVYSGWERGQYWDDAISRVAAEAGIAEEGFAPIRADAWEPAKRLEVGAAAFETVTVTSAPPAITPYFEAGILNFVFGEMWVRPGLDQRARRWITLVGVADSSSEVPIQSHTYAAMRSGDATLEEMQEFVLQYAVHGGWPKGSVMQGAVFKQGQRVAQGLPFEA